MNGSSRELNTQDINIVAAITVFAGVTVLLAGLLSDVIYAAAGPESAGDMTEPVTTDSSTTAKSGVDVAAFASRRTLVLRRFLRNKPAVVSLAVLLLMFIGCYALPPLLPYNYSDLDYFALQQPPSTDHWFGTNGLGQDLLAQTLRGMQKSMLIGVCVAFISTVIAATVGTIAGYFGGWRDRALMWLVDLMLVVPSFLLITIVVQRTKGDIVWMIVLLSVFSWMISSRIVRGMTMSLREREFVVAARYMGVRDSRIIVRHILPNVASIIIIDTALNVGVADPRRDRAELPGFRRPATRCVAGNAHRRRHPVGDDVPMAVPVSRRCSGPDHLLRQPRSATACATRSTREAVPCGRHANEPARGARPDRRLPDRHRHR